MGLFKIFNKGKEIDKVYSSRRKAEKEIKKSVNRSKKNPDFDSQNLEDFKIKKIKL